MSYSLIFNQNYSIIPLLYVASVYTHIIEFMYELIDIDILEAMAKFKTI